MIASLYKKYGELLRYLIIGVLTTVVSLATYYALVFTLLDPENPFELQLANILSWVASVLFAYYTNRRFVFQLQTRSTIKEFLKFVVSRLFTLLVDMAIMFTFVTILRFDDKLVKLANQAVVIILNFLLSKFLVFIKPKPTNEIKPQTEPKE